MYKRKKSNRDTDGLSKTIPLQVVVLLTQVTVTSKQETAEA